MLYLPLILALKTTFWEQKSFQESIRLIKRKVGTHSNLFGLACSVCPVPPNLPCRVLFGLLLHNHKIQKSICFGKHFQTRAQFQPDFQEVSALLWDEARSCIQMKGCWQSLQKDNLGRIQ